MTPNRRIFLNIIATYGRSVYALVCGAFAVGVGGAGEGGCCAMHKWILFSDYFKNDESI